jgi:YVTN family beta-propeller protein
VTRGNANRTTRAAASAGLLLSVGLAAACGSAGGPPQPSGTAPANPAAGGSAAGAPQGRPVTVYVLVEGFGPGYVIPVDAATGTVGPPIILSDTSFQPDGIAITPDGSTVYIVNGYIPYYGDVIPIRTATNTAGTEFTVSARLEGIAVAPDGKTAYVVSGYGGITPFSTATDQAGADIESVGYLPQDFAFSPDGKTAYVTGITRDSHPYGIVTAIQVATGTAWPPIRVGSALQAGYGSQIIAATPDGTTVYVANYDDGTVIPIRAAVGRPFPLSPAAGTAGPPIKVGAGPSFIAITPDGKTAYVLNQAAGTVTPIATATDTAGPPITIGTPTTIGTPLGLGPAIEAIAITPDGKTAYVTSYNTGTVVPISTATNTPGPPIRTGNGASYIAITPDGKTAYVSNQKSGTVTPISIATNTPGRPIRVGTRPGPIVISP